MQQPELKIRCRAAIDEDAEPIAAIYNHYVDVGGATFDATHLAVPTVRKRIAMPKPDGWYVADPSSGVSAMTRLLGWASARRYSERYGYRFCCETAIYISPQGVGHGIADQLQRMIDQHCQACSLHHAVAKVIADNERSMAFHFRHGYELVGVQKEIGRMQDRWVDVAILQKIYR